MAFILLDVYQLDGHTVLLPILTGAPDVNRHAEIVFNNLSVCPFTRQYPITIAPSALVCFKSS